MWCAHIYICMVLHVWGHTCVCMEMVNVHVCMWRPKVDKSSIFLLRHSLTKSWSLSQIQNSSICLFYESHLCRRRLGYRQTATPARHLCGFLGIQCWSSHLCGRRSNCCHLNLLKEVFMVRALLINTDYGSARHKYLLRVWRLLLRVCPLSPASQGSKARHL